MARVSWPRSVPSRSCVACRTSRPKRDLVRVVRTPDGRVLIDQSGRLAGRGAYLCRDGACWRIAHERGTLARALNSTVPAELQAVLAAGPSPSPTIDEGGARGQE